VNQTPRPNPAYRPPPVTRNAAAMLAFRTTLTDAQCREVVETMAGYRDPVVLTALAAGIGAAIAARGLAGEPPPRICPEGIVEWACPCGRISVSLRPDDGLCAGCRPLPKRIPLDVIGDEASGGAA
jgi:hypothetical protein